MTIRISFNNGRFLVLHNVEQYTLKDNKRLVIEFRNEYEKIFINFDEVLHVGEASLYNVILERDEDND